jgi:hypothetical protein
MLGGFLAAAIGALAVQQQCGDCPQLKPLPGGGLGCVFEAAAVYDIQVCTLASACVFVLFRGVCVDALWPTRSAQETGPCVRSSGARTSWWSRERC